MVLAAPVLSQNYPLHRVHATNFSMSLYAITAGWNSSKPSGPNPSITITQGDTVSLSLISGDSAQHRFLLDVDKDGPPLCAEADPCSSTIDPGQTVPLNVPGNIPAGNYTYYCVVHPTLMFGRFDVKPIPDFTLSLSQSSLVLAPGQSGTSNVTVKSQLGLTGNVTFSATNVGLINSFSKSSVILPANEAAWSILTVTASSASGNYNLTISASTGSISHSTPLHVSVVAVTDGPTRNLLIFGGIAAALIAVTVVSLFASRRRKPSIQ